MASPLLAATFQLLLPKLVLTKGAAPGAIAVGLALNALLSTPIMMVQMALLQLVSGKENSNVT